MGSQQTTDTVARQWLAAAVIAWPAAAAVGAPVPLSSLSAPTVQTLIDLGGDGVTSGGERYYDFAYRGDVGSPLAADVAVQAAPSASPGTAGLRFVAAWLADDGSAESGTLSYAVAPTDPSAAIDRIGLVVNGTAPVPAAGTFATSTLLADGPQGQLDAPLLTTFDDGRTFPVDTTAADVDAVAANTAGPAADLFVTDTVTVASSAPSGVATGSVVQNLFTAAAVPEPAGTAAALLAAVGLIGLRQRRVRVG